VWYYFLLLALFLARKIWDQVRSRRNARALAERGGQPARDAALVLFWITHLAFFILVPMELVLLCRQFIPALGLPMLALFVVAMLLRWWSTHLLAGHWTSQVAVPVDMEPVTRGPYRWIRHPNYLAMTMELIALSLVYTTYLSASVVAAFAIISVVVRIRREEQSLFQLPAYRAAMAQKARLIPGIY
jgi:methyltransferase